MENVVLEGESVMSSDAGSRSILLDQTLVNFLYLHESFPVVAVNLLVDLPTPSLPVIHY